MRPTLLCRLCTGTDEDKGSEQATNTGQGLLYPVLWQSTRAHQEGATVGRVGRMAQWFRAGQAPLQREPRRLLSAISKNPAQWKALFEYLSHTDLLAISKGKHKIPGTQLVVSVEDSQNGPLAKRRSESHNHHIDFQYVVKGTERFGIIDHYTSIPNSKYRPDVIHYDYQVEKARFYDSNPDEFFIFFPRDWHIAKVENDTNDQQIRVIVIKVDYMD